jgi:hypothetical protein
VFERGISGDTISPDQFILLINAEGLEGGEKICTTGDLLLLAG